MQTKAVLFDMDGLMFDTERLADEIWISLAPQFGYTLDSAGVSVLRGRNKHDGGIALRALLGDEVPYEAWWEAAHTELLHRLEDAVPLRPKLLELLDHLHALALPLAVVSSSHTSSVEHHLARTGLRDRFTCVIGGDRVVHSKPAPDIYLLGAQTLGIAPTDCLVLEDSYNGCRAGHAAGCRVVMVPDLDPATPEMRAITVGVVKDLMEAAAYL